MSVNKDETLRQFCDVTGADETRSKFFLESSNWQLEVALSSFYEHGGNADDAPSSLAAPPLITLSDSDMDSSPTPPPASEKQKKDLKKTSNTKFATLGSLQQDSSSDEEEEISQDARYESVIAMEQEIETLKREVQRLLNENCELRKEIARLKDDSLSGQAFYAGGSERSGQQILGPGKNRKDIVTEMFKSVRERGAVVFEDEPSSSSRGRGGVFAGAGYRLGQTSDDHEQVTPSNTQQPDQPRSVRLRLYREGFTVDQGAIRQYTDPENAEFLSFIRRGEIPPELSRGGGEVRVSLEDRRHDECPKHVASAPHPFTGKGHLLGSPTPATVGAAPVAVAAATAAGGPAPDRSANQRAAQAAVTLDETSPLTTIQFRLADGSRITGRFNHSHTVADLHEYVGRAEPAYQHQPFALLTTFPSSELSDPAVTLEKANLLNSTLLQRLK